jgi:hypothetical protein
MPLIIGFIGGYIIIGGFIFAFLLKYIVLPVIGFLILLTAYEYYEKWKKGEKWKW